MRSRAPPASGRRNLAANRRSKRLLVLSRDACGIKASHGSDEGLDTMRLPHRVGEDPHA
jgi:hypothetical protein